MSSDWWISGEIPVFTSDWFTRSKWGGEEAGAAATDSGITAYQLTRWLKNVELIEGKKVISSLSYQSYQS